MSKDEIRNLINEALSFGYHTAKDEAKGIPSAGYGTRFFDTYLIEQKLNIHSIGGPVSDVCGGEQLPTEAVDTGVWDGERCPRCKSVNLVDVDDHWTKCRDCKFRFVGG